MVMLSMPPATMTALAPAVMRSCDSIAAFMPEPHILLIVVQPTESGMPAPIEACRAGACACPCPADNILPMMTSSISSPLSPARATAARIASAPSSEAVAFCK